MKRIIKVLVVTALMVVLMATTVSPAFAQQGIGFGVDKKKQDITAGNAGIGYNCGEEDRDPPRSDKC